VNDQIQVWVIIPTWNRRDDLIACLESIMLQEYEPFKTLVVDNGSTDGTVETVRSQFPQVNILAMDENKGSSAASNAGFRVALDNGAKYILRLDSDTVLDSHFLAAIVKATEAWPKAGISVGKIFYFHDPERIWSLGALKKSWDLGASELARGELDGLRYSDPQEIDYAWSTGMLLTKSVLEMSAGFDPDFFVYYEEADLCQRVREAGFEIISVPAARMWHKVGQSSRSKWVAFQWGRSKMLFFRKHSRGLHRALLVIYAYMYAFTRAIWPGKGGGNRGPLFAALSGLSAGLRHRL